MTSSKIKLYHWLTPLSVIYGAGGYFRNKLFDFGILKSEVFDIPVICVGNIAVGGTGKTPHIEFLIRLLQPHYKVAVLSRGYKRKSKGFQLSNPDSTPAQLGDEPYQIFSKFPGIIVAADADRRNGIRQLMALTSKPEVILLDDAYQHRYVKAGLNILLTDYHRKIYEDKILPAGRLRESMSGIKRADLAIVTKCPNNLKPDDTDEIERKMGLKESQPLFFSGLHYGELRPVFPSISADERNNLPSHLKNDEREHMEFTKETEVLMVTGIAQPKLLQTYLKEQYTLKEQLIFPDHHNFTKNDIQQIDAKFSNLKNKQKCIIVTEKDAVRLQHNPYLTPSLKKNMYFLPLEVVILQNQTKRFNQIILDYVAKNQRNS
ncbi:MAG: tetraacyldisaccharide 4'-kinase [Bacteroidales bacterium]